MGCKIVYNNTVTYKKDGVIFMSLNENLNNEWGNFEQLTERLCERLKDLPPLTKVEKERLEMELDVIRQTHTADLFLQLVDTMYALKDTGAVFHGLIHGSYICYLLGLTKINPLEYGLPFERFYHTDRKMFPTVHIAVLRDKKALAEEILSKKLTRFEYVVEEAKIGECRHFTEEEIYKKALQYFRERGISLGGQYQGNKLAEEIVSKTDGRYIYQSQFFEICTKILGVSNKRADDFRKRLAIRRMSDREAIKQFFIWKLDEDGAALFDYIYTSHPFVVSKAYILGILFLDFD